MSGLRGAAAIAGIGETALGHLPGSNVMDLCAEAARLSCASMMPASPRTISTD